jgi:peptidoglycan/LPS O-acetylase OafA/YrhL
MSVPAVPVATPSHRIKELDGLRGVSVLFVVVFHMTKYSGYINLSETSQLICSNLGEVGVQIFFVISGFIITQLLIEEHRRTGRISLRGFYTRRFFRIMPAYWIYSVSILLLAIGGVIVLKEGTVPQAAGFLVSTLFLSDIFYPSWFWGHTWSLSVEEQFYILFPLCFRTIYKSGRKTLVMAVFLILVYISAFFSATLTDAFTSGLYLAYSHFNWSRYLYLGRFFSYQYIAVGVSMAFFWKVAASLLARLPIFFYLLVISLIILFSLGNQPQDIKLLYSYIYPLLIGSLVGGVMVKPQYVGFLRWRMIQFIGACSYSIYLWQQLFTGDSARYGSIPLANPFIALPLIFLCATLSHFFVEQKFIALGKRFRGAKLPKPDKAPGHTHSAG